MDPSASCKDPFVFSPFFSGGVMIYFDRIEVVNFLIQSAGESQLCPRAGLGLVGTGLYPGGAGITWREPGCPSGRAEFAGIQAVPQGIFGLGLEGARLSLRRG